MVFKLPLCIECGKEITSEQKDFNLGYCEICIRKKTDKFDFWSAVGIIAFGAWGALGFILFPIGILITIGCWAVLGLIVYYTIIKPQQFKNQLKENRLKILPTYF